MANAVVSRFGDSNHAGSDETQLFLKVWSGMVLGAFNKATVTEMRHIVRTIKSGKSAQFPAQGLASASFHTVGTEIDFDQINAAERVIEIDGLLLAPVFVDLLDEAMNHYDVRRIYTEQQGRALAEESDARVLRSMIAGSRTATPTVTGLPGGDEIIDASIGTSAAVLKGAVYDAAEDLDEANIPRSERTLYVAPAQYHLLLQDGEFLDRDFGGEGSRASGEFKRAAGFEIVVSNNIPGDDDQAVGSLPSDLQLDYSNVVAVASHKSAAGTVKLIGLDFESVWDPNRQGTMLIAKQATGHNYLRPEAAVAFSTS